MSARDTTVPGSCMACGSDPDTLVREYAKPVDADTQFFGPSTDAPFTVQGNSHCRLRSMLVYGSGDFKEYVTTWLEHTVTYSYEFWRLILCTRDEFAANRMRLVIELAIEQDMWICTSVSNVIREHGIDFLFIEYRLRLSQADTAYPGSFSLSAHCLSDITDAQRNVCTSILTHWVPEELRAVMYCNPGIFKWEAELLHQFGVVPPPSIMNCDYTQAESVDFIYAISTYDPDVFLRYPLACGTRVHTRAAFVRHFATETTAEDDAMFPAVVKKTGLSPQRLADIVRTHCTLLHHNGLTNFAVLRIYAPQMLHRIATYYDNTMWELQCIQQVLELPRIAAAALLSDAYGFSCISSYYLTRHIPMELYVLSKCVKQTARVIGTREHRTDIGKDFNDIFNTTEGSLVPSLVLSNAAHQARHRLDVIQKQQFKCLMLCLGHSVPLEMRWFISSFKL